VLLMYLWAALFSGMVVGLSVLRIDLIYLVLATVVAVIALLLATMPGLRPWRGGGKRARARGSRVRSNASFPGRLPAAPLPGRSPRNAEPVPPVARRP
jgi:hypothetical protein